ncbi:Universal stress protein A-like protein [Morus notabilis]|uniref:Universal stress protein A-like protein n=1 Tax=Morus notabilis TaxID=981085 RepID=W9QCU2_9ROSA|nr:universal stress protein PHOS34 [Morus notabilis]EXB28600.1 Universal stress protein A-like protein [Morus notabilis]
MKGESKIVVAVDESEESMYALSWCLSNLLSRNAAAAAAAAANNTTLVLLYVKPPLPVYSSFDAAGYLFSGDVIGSMEKYCDDMVHSVMERAEAVFRNFGTNMNIEKKVGSGDAKDVICHTVDKLNADTLVMGSHGYGFLKRTLLGSVSDYCAKHVKCPVVIVKHPKHN